jgi:ABC-type bacteriocin/lantibiotic exporter with double-glycine peptidase domain
MNIKISKKVSVKQHDQSDCGAACMASVLAYYGRLMHCLRCKNDISFHFI